MDQCKHCQVRGNFEICKETPCSHRENWIFREAVEQAHMAGQMGAGCLHPSYSNAGAYFDYTYQAENKSPDIKMKVKDDCIATTDDFWYDLTDGGYLKPEDILENQDDIKQVKYAIAIVMNFQHACEHQIDGFIQ